MDDSERLEVVLEELRLLLRAMPMVAEHTYLIGGQVLALHAKSQGGPGVIQVETNTGVRILRGFSFEPDLLIDVDSIIPYEEELTYALRDLEYGRASGHSYTKIKDGVSIQVDLFRPDDSDDNNDPTRATPLPNSDAALANPKQLTISLPNGTLTISTPDIVGFLRLKLDAKLKHRPDKDKDSFDIWVCTKLFSRDRVREALWSNKEHGETILDELFELFCSDDAEGIEDILAYASTLGDEEKQLVAREAIDDFTFICTPLPST